MAKRISVINFKGGVGKTTLAFNLAAGLARAADHPRVLLVDLDHQSSLSIVCLEPGPWQARVNRGLTSDAIFRPFVTGAMAPPSCDLIVDLPLSRYPSLKLVPASLSLDDTEIELTASHHGNAIQSEWDKRTLLCRWFEHCNVDEEFEYVIIDCPPATKIVAQNAIAASHGYVIPVVPEAVMERGAPHLATMIRTGIDVRLHALSTLGEHRPTFVDGTPLVALVVTKVQPSRAASGYTLDASQHMQSLERTWGAQLATPYIFQTVGVPEAMTAGVPVYDRAHTQNIRNRRIDRAYAQLTQELRSRIDAL